MITLHAGAQQLGLDKNLLSTPQSTELPITPAVDLNGLLSHVLDNLQHVLSILVQCACQHDATGQQALLSLDEITKTQTDHQVCINNLLVPLPRTLRTPALRVHTTSAGSTDRTTTKTQSRTTKWRNQNERVAF